MDTIPTPTGLASWLACLAFAVWLLLMLLKLADRMRGKSPEPPNAQIHQSHEELRKEHRETRARVIQLESWRTGLSEQLLRSNEPILRAGEDREKSLATTIESVRKELDAKIQAVEDKIELVPERIVTMLKNIQGLSR